jgi:carbamoyl-phosphate synthase small subunit
LKKPAVLLLEDGWYLEGDVLGATGEAFGEVVFNTSMTGYQEILTDPSYRGQMITMTYPHIGNYGVNADDTESSGIWAAGFIVKEASSLYSNHRATGGLDPYLKENGIVGIQGIDTRALTKHIRLEGAMKGAISSSGTDIDTLKERLLRYPSIIGLDLVREVTTDISYTLYEIDDPIFNVVLMDYGAKHNIVRELTERGCRVLIMPASTGAKEILKQKPDGVMLSNGPGDPAAVTYAIETIKDLLGKVPVFGICLGHQLLGLALGGKTFKLKFGHRGANHPVMNLKDRTVEITSQNHGFAVDAESFDRKQARNIEVTHVNLNDKTVEGLRCKDVPAFSVQYHPEASPGPHDSKYLFDAFIEMMS